MTRSHGYTLVELLAGIAVSSVLLVTATTAIHRAMAVQSSWKERADVNRVLGRLSRTFRADVHQAREARLVQDPLVLSLVLDTGANVTYEFAADEIIRDYQSDGEPRRREFFAMSDDCQPNARVGGDSTWAELMVARDVKLVDVEPRIVMHVMAEVGRRQRLARAGGEP